jgi:indolepyruvate ferredoxin oxidoreductase beta subunit
MKYDIVLAGVGGQGVLSMAALIGRAAITEGLVAKQSEVHGMAQRGGAVQAHLRLADGPIESDLIANGTAALILSLEPVEALRYLPSLSPSGCVVTAAAALVNVPDYPDPEVVRSRIRSLPRAVVVDAERLAEEAGDLMSVNTVMVGAAAHLLPLRVESLEQAVARTFGPKGERMLRVNLAAFLAGRRAAS